MKFRKRPVVVDAVQWTVDNLREVQEFTGPLPGSEHPAFYWDGRKHVVWAEHERCWVAVPRGHWVVRGALGELYPISPAALAATYEPVGGAE